MSTVWSVRFALWFKQFGVTLGPPLHSNLRMKYPILAAIALRTSVGASAEHDWPATMVRIGDIRMLTPQRISVPQGTYGG